MAWYFSSEGCIKAKGRSKLIVPEIQKEFLKFTSKSGIVAVFMTSIIQPENQPVVYFEYLDREKFSKKRITKLVYSAVKEEYQMVFCRNSWTQKQRKTVNCKLIKTH